MPKSSAPAPVVFSENGSEPQNSEDLVTVAPAAWQYLDDDVSTVAPVVAMFTLSDEKYATAKAARDAGDNAYRRGAIRAFRATQDDPATGKPKVSIDQLRRALKAAGIKGFASKGTVQALVLAGEMFTLPGDLPPMTWGAGARAIEGPAALVCAYTASKKMPSGKEYGYQIEKNEHDVIFSNSMEFADAWKTVTATTREKLADAREEDIKLVAALSGVATKLNAAKISANLTKALDLLTAIEEAEELTEEDLATVAGIYESLDMLTGTYADPGDHEHDTEDQIDLQQLADETGLAQVETPIAGTRPARRAKMIAQVEAEKAAEKAARVAA